MIDLVLCIDDDPITLMLSKMVIKKSSFCNEIITLQNGEEAIEYFQELAKQDLSNTKYPCLIFLDLNMPVMNGWEFLDSYMKNNFNTLFEKTKVLVLSSTIDPYDIEKSKSYPIVIDFLSKPIKQEMLDQLKTLND